MERLLFGSELAVVVILGLRFGQHGRDGDTAAAEGDRFGALVLGFWRPAFGFDGGRPRERRRKRRFSVAGFLGLVRAGGRLARERIAGGGAAVGTAHALARGHGRAGHERLGAGGTGPGAGEFGDERLGVELEEVGVGTEKAADIHRRGQLVEAFVFERLEEARRDAGLLGNLLDGDTAMDARVTETLADEGQGTPPPEEWDIN